MSMSQTTQQQISELRHRVEAKRKRLEARLEEAKADGSEKARNTTRSVQAKLGELDEHLRDGWESVTDATIGKINAWLKSDDS